MSGGQICRSGGCKKPPPTSVGTAYIPSPGSHVADVSSSGLNLLAVLLVERHSPHPVPRHLTSLQGGRG